MIPRKKPMRRSGKGLQPRPHVDRKKRAPVKPRNRATAEAYAQLRVTVHARAGGRCERCGTPVGVHDMEAHHRKLRSQGGRDELVNLVALCSDCHHTQVHAHPERARGEGWIVRSGSDPAAVAVTLHDGRTVRLDADGGYDCLWLADGTAA